MDDDQEIEQSPDDVFRTACGFELVLGLIAIIVGWAVGPDARDFIPNLDAEGSKEILRGVVYGCLAAIPLLIVIELVQRIPCEAVRELERFSEDGMIKTLLSLSFAELIVISICAGVGEELLFRGWLLPWIAGGSGGITDETTVMEIILAIGASSLIFGLVHPITKLYILLAAVMGVFFGLLLLWTENLIVPIAAHAAYDAAQLMIAKHKDSKPEPKDNPTQKKSLAGSQSPDGSDDLPRRDIPLSDSTHDSSDSPAGEIEISNSERPDATSPSDANPSEPKAGDNQPR